EPVLRREFAHSVDFIRTYRRSGKLLELGAAYGFFLLEAARHFDVAGIELAADAVEHGRRAGLNVVQGMADEATLRQFGHMDVIVLLDVIEHLPDPRETLALCHRQLKPGGIVVITTGDFRSAPRRVSRGGGGGAGPPPAPAAARRGMAADAPAAAPLVLHPGEHAPDVAWPGIFDGACGPPLEDRS